MPPMPQIDFKVNVFNIVLVAISAVIFIIRGEGQIAVLKVRMDSVEQAYPAAIRDMRGDIQELTMEVVHLREQLAREQGRQERRSSDGQN